MISIIKSTLLRTLVKSILTFKRIVFKDILTFKRIVFSDFFVLITIAMFSSNLIGLREPYTKKAVLRVARFSNSPKVTDLSFLGLNLSFYC
jgi:hypothetical protein